MGYILIIWIIGTGIHSVEFSDKTACENALNRFYQYHRAMDGNNGICVKKESFDTIKGEY